MPVHWKGFALVLGSAGIMVPSLLAGLAVREWSFLLSIICFAPGVVVFFASFWAVEQHIDR